MIPFSRDENAASIGSVGSIRIVLLTSFGSPDFVINEIKFHHEYG
jgi:hypothetical protein